jgi:hypothetical protein
MTIIIELWNSVDVVALLQGDVEKNLGWKPIPLFDRDNYAEVASMQVRMDLFHRAPNSSLRIEMAPLIFAKWR